MNLPKIYHQFKKNPLKIDFKTKIKNNMEHHYYDLSPVSHAKDK